MTLKSIVSTSKFNKDNTTHQFLEIKNIKDNISVFKAPSSITDDYMIIKYDEISMLASADFYSYCTKYIMLDKNTFQMTLIGLMIP